MRRPLVAALILLTACRSVPDVTQVPVPSGPTVFHGAYTGTLTEGLTLVAATPDPDGTHLHAAARTSQHTTLLTLDLATGRELRRQNVPVADPQDVARRADGTVVLAGWQASATLDPQTLQVTTTLPGAVRVSADGERLLVRQSGGQLTRVRTRDGQAIPTVVLTLPYGDDWLAGLSPDLEWAVTENGDTLLNLSTGQRIDTSGGHLNPCPNTPRVLPVATALAVSPQGFVLGQSNQTLEWRNWDGTLRAARWMATSCPMSSQPDWLLTLQGGVLGYRFRDDQTNEVVVGRWEERAEPQVFARNQETAAMLPFHDLFVLGDPEAYLQLWGAEPLGLRLGGRWKQTYEPARFPVATRITASYQDEDHYGLQGTLEALGGTYAIRGTGINSGRESGVVFTQRVCGVPPFAPSCPITRWDAKLRLGEQEVGSLIALDLDPTRSGPGREVQAGYLGVDVQGERRNFVFRLMPSTGP